MKVYSVKQIAEMLNTNPETIRRWIRDGKLQAVQISRKDGNQVSEDALNKFLESSPKYLSKAGTAVGTAVGTATAVSPALGIAALAGGLIASTLISFFGTQKQQSITRIKADDFKAFLIANCEKAKEMISQKESLIKQTENEILELRSQFTQYQYILEHDDLVEKTIQLAESQEIHKEVD